MKKSLEERFRRRFPNLKYTKLVLFRNPSEFGSMFIERINPNHHGLVWGQRRKHLKKGTAYIKVGEIWFAVVVAAYSLSQAAWIDALTGYVFSIMINVLTLTGVVCLVTSMFLYFMPVELSDYEPKKKRKSEWSNSSYILGV
jgi:hypothetical protein